MTEPQNQEVVSETQFPKLPFIDGNTDTANDDEKFVSGLSTILVASIQETKDRISQIEYIFCTQLFPNLRSKSKTLTSLGNRLKQREAEIAELRGENRRMSEELVVKRRRVEELRREVDEGMVLQKSLVELVQSKGLLISESEEKRKAAVAKLSELEERLEAKTRGFEEGEELREKLRVKVSERERELKESEEKRKAAVARLSELEERWEAKTREFEEVEELREKLRLQVLENEVLVEKVKGLEERVIGEEMYRKMVEEVESVNCELQSERVKRSRLTEAYKRLKSQHNYLREKVGLTAENMVQQKKSENESDLAKDKSPVVENGKEKFLLSLSLMNV